MKTTLIAVATLALGMWNIGCTKKPTSVPFEEISGGETDGNGNPDETEGSTDGSAGSAGSDGEEGTGEIDPGIEAGVGGETVPHDPSQDIYQVAFDIAQNEMGCDQEEAREFADRVEKREDAVSYLAAIVSAAEYADEYTGMNQAQIAEFAQRIADSPAGALDVYIEAFKFFDKELAESTEDSFLIAINIASLENGAEYLAIYKRVYLYARDGNFGQISEKDASQIASRFADEGRTQKDFDHFSKAFDFAWRVSTAKGMNLKRTPSFAFAEQIMNAENSMQKLEFYEIAYKNARKDHSKADAIEIASQEVGIDFTIN